MTNKKRQEKAARQLRNQKKMEEKLATMDNPVDECRQLYARAWSSENATHFASKKYYDWMASFVKNRPRVLEIGTGDGNGTIALCKNGSRVVSLDFNPHCMAIAKTNLEASGIPFNHEERSRFYASSDSTPAISYKSVRSQMPEIGVQLIDADILTERGILDWLTDNKQFDAVVCWNIGADFAVTARHKTKAEYRMLVHRQVFQIANACLPPGGILHFIDRGHSIDRDFMYREAADLHQRFAQGMDLILDPQIGRLDYESPPNTPEIIMTADEKAVSPDTQMVFWSTISRRA